MTNERGACEASATAGRSGEKGLKKSVQGHCWRRCRGLGPLRDPFKGTDCPSARAFTDNKHGGLELCEREVEVDVLGSPSLIISVDVKQH